MLITKRDGTTEPVNLSKIEKRIEVLSYGLRVEPILVAKKVIDGLFDGVSTAELDTLAVRTASGLILSHPDYDTLAARLSASILHKNTPATFSEAIEILASRVDATGRKSPCVSDDFLHVVRAYADVINAAIKHERDFTFDYLGFSTLEHSYLTRVDGKIVERPQYMWMRVAIGIHGSNLERAFETYDLLSRKAFTHATPTLFNAGTPRPQMSSCFLLEMHDDSIKGIYKTLSDCAAISQYAGGIGLHIHKIRSAGSHIAGTNGTSNGIVPMLKNFDATANYVDQGGGKRKGSIAIYLEPWHADIEDFLDLKRPTGKEELRCRTLYYGLWVPDLFMERVDTDVMWTLMDPSTCPGLDDCFGDDFVKLYTSYEAAGKGVRTIKARDLWKRICDVQVETSMPYIMYKDAINSKSNQQNVGTIKSSNLCTEIVQYTSPTETAVCNLASLSLPYFVKDGAFDFDELRRVTKIVVRNLNLVIDKNFYPTPEALASNMRHRPIGVGVQGLANVFMMLKHAWGTVESRELNIRIFEHIYFAALEASNELAMTQGAYSSFAGSPASKGELQFDLWELAGSTPLADFTTLPWAALTESIKKHGLRNSLLVAPMPTASTANVLGNTEGFEPIPHNLYKRKVLSGEFVVLNKYLVNDLMAIGKWDDSVRTALQHSDGSIQGIPGIPDDIKRRYATVYEIPQRIIIDMAADRGQFIDQSQSMNVFMGDPSYSKLSSMHFYGWRKGLKTGSYYIRQPSTVTAKKVTEAQPSQVEQAIAVLLDRKLISPDRSELIGLSTEEIIMWATGACSTANPGDCVMCSG